MVDERGSERDAAGGIARLFEFVTGDEFAASIQELLLRLGTEERDLRDWIARSFLDAHIRDYSASGRRAPVYWQLANPSASYSVWLYYHRLSKDTLYTVLNDYAQPKFHDEERRLTRLVQEAGPAATSSQRKDIDEQERFVAELHTLRDEVARVAPLWNPNLNDGVLINFAPLWRLVPHNRSWQQECKRTWDKLVKGDYDWAHLAMHLWPERVVPGCAEDRSLAIAHGLEDVFWQEGEGGEWERRDVSQAEMEALIGERTSPSVKAALDDLLSAPAPAGGTKRAGRRRRKKG